MSQWSALCLALGCNPQTCMIQGCGKQFRGQHHWEHLVLSCGGTKICVRRLRQNDSGIWQFWFQNRFFSTAPLFNWNFWWKLQIAVPSYQSSCSKLLWCFPQHVVKMGQYANYHFQQPNTVPAALLRWYIITMHWLQSSGLWWISHGASWWPSANLLNTFVILLPCGLEIQEVFSKQLGRCRSGCKFYVLGFHGRFRILLARFLVDCEKQFLLWLKSFRLIFSRFDVCEVDLECALMLWKVPLYTMCVKARLSCTVDTAHL